MKSIYERMVDIIRKHYPSACYITPAQSITEILRFSFIKTFTQTPR